MSLRDAAAAAAGRDPRSAEAASEALGVPISGRSEGTGEASGSPTGTPEPLTRPELPDTTSDDPQSVPVHTALLRAIRDLGFVKKTGTYEQGRTKYSYRSVDAVVNAANVVMERHGLLFLPEVVEHSDRDVQSAGGGRMSHAIVTTRWHVIGPAGDVLPFSPTTIGHALDTSDKAFNKAQSVAWRIALIQVFQMVTGDPDPDAVRIDRGEAPAFDPNIYRDEALNPQTSPARMSQMIHELKTTGHGHEIVENEVGEPEKIGPLVVRVRRERSEQ